MNSLMQRVDGRLPLTGFDTDDCMEIAMAYAGVYGNALASLMAADRARGSAYQTSLPVYASRAREIADLAIMSGLFACGLSPINPDNR